LIHLYRATELGVILAVLLGWQFTVAEFVRGPILVIVLVVLFRIFLASHLIEEARREAEKGVAGVESPGFA
jgi:uncharacterized protein